MMTNEAINKICVFLAYVSFAGCLLIWGRISGIEKGYFYGVFQSHQIYSGFGWSIDHYQIFNNWYFYITVGFGIYIVGKLLKPSFVSSAIYIFALAISFQQHLDMLIFNGYELTYAAKVNNNIWIQNAPYFHWLLLAVVVILLAAEFFLMNARKSESVVFSTNT